MHIFDRNMFSRVIFLLSLIPIIWLKGYICFLFVFSIEMYYEVECVGYDFLAKVNVFVSFYSCQ